METEDTISELPVKPTVPAGAVVVSEEDLEELSRTFAQLDSSSNDVTLQHAAQSASGQSREVKQSQESKQQPRQQQQPKSRGYQETRKHNQDRRDNRRKTSDDYDDRVDTRKSAQVSEKNDRLDKKRVGGGGNTARNSATKPPDDQNKTKGKAVSDAEAKLLKEEEARRQKEEEQKAKEEEERMRAEQQRLKEEEELRKKREEEERIAKEENHQLDEYIAECNERLAFKAELREKNLTAADNRPDESFFTRLDSSLKKNTAFVKKLRNLTESQKDALMKECEGLNLTKYIGEVVTAITDAKMKMTDINCALSICSMLHRRYADFAPTLIDSCQKTMLIKKDEKITNPSKFRVDLRFFADLVATAVISERDGLSLLAGQLTLLVNGDKDEHNNLSIVSSFCKHCGDDYAGLTPRKIGALAAKYQRTLPTSQVLAADRQKACRTLLKDYYQSLTKHVLHDYKELRKLEKQNRRILQTKGELSTERKECMEAAQQAFVKLQQNAATFADLVDEEMPEFPEEVIDPAEVNSFGEIGGVTKEAEGEYDGDKALFEDEDTRQFYESLPDLKAIIPGILYKDSESSATKDAATTSPAAAAATTTDGQAAPADGSKEEDLKVEDVEQEMAQMLTKKSEDKEEDGHILTGDDEKEPSEDTSVAKEEAAAEADPDTGAMLKLFEAFLARLPNCVNRELVDSAAVEFCMTFNTKINRRRLVRTLATVPRTRYDLLPFYARLVAVLHPCMPDVATDLEATLKNDFRYHVRKKDQINIESKLKVVRFIGELVKFGMYGKADALQCLKMLLFDFTYHNIEMACSLLETCGRFLYRSPDSHNRTRVYLDVMMRKKTAMMLDSRYTTLIENAYYYCNPPETKAEKQKERNPVYEYVRKLLYKDLSRVTIEKVLKQIRKLNWDSVEVRLFITRSLTEVWNVRYNCIHCVANVLAGLALYHEDVAIQVMDGVLEDIRVGMEVNHPKFNQRRVCCVKFLAELYNYRMIESQVIFRTLYSLITFGVATSHDVPSYLDPPEHLFRLRLVCVMLETCGLYFDKGSSKRKLDFFLTYFQRYYWFKRSHPCWTEERPFPRDVEHMMLDMLESLRPKLLAARSYEEACREAESLDKYFKSKLGNAIIPREKHESVTSDSTEGGEDGLTTIAEAEELDEHHDLSQHHEAEGSAQESDGEEDGTRSEARHRGNVEDSEKTADEDASEAEHNEEVTVLSGGPKHVQCPEDDEFLNAFEKMVSENLQSRLQENIKVPVVDIAIPGNVKRAKLLSSGDDEAENVEKEENMQFTMLSKKGSKIQFSALSVPMSSSFASKFREREEMERTEKERIKRVVLDFHERQEEEDYQDAQRQKVALMNTNRDRRVHYQHPKGAPDVDMIFGSKKVA